MVEMMKAGSTNDYGVSQANADHSTSLWVVNRTAAIHKVPTVLDMEIIYGDGTVPVSLPGTWIPVDLSTYAPKSSFLENPAFLTLVRNGMIQLMRPKQAEDLLATSAGVRERQKIEARAAQRAINLAEEPGAEKKPEVNLEAGVNPVIRAAVERDFDEYEMESVLLNNMVTEIDVTYVKAKMPDKSRLHMIATDKAAGGTGIIIEEPAVPERVS